MALSQEWSILDFSLELENGSTDLNEIETIIKGIVNCVKYKENLINIADLTRDKNKLDGASKSRCGFSLGT